MKNLILCLLVSLILFTMSFTADIVTSSMTLLSAPSALTINYVIPAGSERNILYYARLYQSASSNITNLYWDRVVLQLSGAMNSSHLDFQIFEDTDGSGTLSDLNQYVLTPGIVINNRITLDLTLKTISLTSTKNFYIVMNLSPTIDYGLEMIHVTLDSIEGRSDYQGTFSPVSCNVTGSGLAKTFGVSSFKSSYTLSTNSVAFNDNTAIPLMTLETRPLVENSKRLSIQCNINSNQSVSLGYLTLYSSSNSSILTSVNIQSGSNSLLLPTADMIASSSYNYILTYTPPPTLSAGVSISITLTKIAGTSYLSGLELLSFGTLPSRDLLIGGIRITTTPNTVSSVFIGGMEVPILKFSAASFFVASTLNSLVLTNTGNISFLNGIGQTNRIDHVYIYSDTNTSNHWDETDQRVFQVDNGNYSFSSPNESVIITLNLFFPTYNTTESTFFITYGLAPNTSSSQSARAFLGNGTYTDSLTQTSHSLLNSLKSSKQSSFSSGIADIYFSSYNILITRAIQGQSECPVYELTVRALSSLATFNLLISNNLSLFTGNDFGISRLALIEDVDQNRQFSAMDRLHDLRTNFGSSTTTDLTLYALTNTFQDYHFLILASFGSQIPTAQFNTDVLNLSVRNSVITSVNTAVAALFPFPRGNTNILLTSNQVSLELLSVTPSLLQDWNQTTLSLSFKITNRYAEALTLNSLSPQFYLSSIGSLNVSYEYNISSTTNFPALLASMSSLTVNFTVTPHRTVEPGSIYLDGYLAFEFSGKKIVLRRSRIFTWDQLVSGNPMTRIQLPTQSVFYKEFPDYIDHVERDTLGVTHSFRNGEILEPGDHLLVYFVRKGQEIDLFRTAVTANGVPLTSFTSPASRFDLDRGTLKIGPIQTVSGTILIQPCDQAGNLYPGTTLSYFTNTSLFAHDFLVYPTKVNREVLGATPLKIGFLLSKPSRVLLSLFNSLGMVIWTSDQTYTNYGYQLSSFNGILPDGSLIPRGLYLMKMKAFETGSSREISALTKFVVY